MGAAVCDSVVEGERGVESDLVEEIGGSGLPNEDAGDAAGVEEHAGVVRCAREPEPVEDVYAQTGGGCVCHPTFLGECPVTWCRHHLDCQDRGTWKDVPRRRAAGEDACSIRIANRGDHTLEAVAVLLGLTRERVRQIEERAVARAGLAFVRADVVGRVEVGEERIAQLRASRLRSFRGRKDGGTK